MVKYNESIIYKICCNDVNVTEIYVGSTTSFRVRKCAHKSRYNNGGDFYVYQFIRSNNGWDNWSMIEIERYNATDKQDLHKRERYWIEELKASLNKYRAYVTIDEKKESLKEYSKEYYQEHKEQIKGFRQVYIQNNKEQIKGYQQVYRQNNKEQIAKHRSEKITCICGSMFTKYKKKRHERSIKHIKYIEDYITK